MTSVIPANIIAQTYTGTTNANGELVTNLPFTVNLISVQPPQGSGLFCFVRKASSGEIVAKMTYSTLEPYASQSTTVTANYLNG